jgi:starch phosphorylase
VEKEMTGTPGPTDGAGGSDYHATVSSARPATDYTARIMMKHDSMAQDLEPGWMLWQK